MMEKSHSSMQKTYRKGAVGALLDEYQRALDEFISLIQGVSATELVAIADPDTADPNCKSIQTVLAHVVRSIYTYAVGVQRIKGHAAEFRERVYRTTADEFVMDLRLAFAYTEMAMADVAEEELEEYDDAKKIRTSWGQGYDIEQMMEHAIVHILRHRRQLERFLLGMRANKGATQPHAGHGAGGVSIVEK
jgi:uncharacterized damage-inducible protein DinB